MFEPVDDDFDELGAKTCENNGENDFVHVRFRKILWFIYFVFYSRGKGSIFMQRMICRL